VGKQITLLLYFLLLGFDDTDFESSMGMWANEYMDDILNWEFHQGFTSTANTGPDSDHTLGNTI